MSSVLGKLTVKARFVVDPGSAPWVHISRAAPVTVSTEPDDMIPRLRRVSADASMTGRGTGRGGKAPEPALKRALKNTGKRCDFVKFIGSREVSVETLMTQFDMTAPNVNGFLTNIHKDHGIGYVKEGGRLRLLLPAGSTWRNIWAT